MESEQSRVYKSLVNEITKGMEQVKQVKASSSTDQETVLKRMLSSYEEALSILNGSASAEQCESAVSSAPDAPASSVSSVFTATQAGEISSGHRRKRNIFTEQISVDTKNFDDGYSWRKYGQKSVLGCKHPRNYYRCTHRVDRGCMALKQVHRSDDDPSKLVVIYRGVHTCSRIEPVASKLAAQGKQKSYWKGYLAQKDGRSQQLDLPLRTKSALLIQSYFRGWIARREWLREKSMESS